MTVPAHLAALSQLSHVAQSPRLYKLCIKLLVAADTVIHHYLPRKCFGLDGLMLHVAHKVSRVLQTVDSLETIIHSQILMGHMTIIAGSTVLMVVDTSVRGVAPRSIIRCHNMTVNAGRRVVAYKIGMCPEQIHKQSAEAAHDARYNQQTHLLSIR